MAKKSPHTTPIRSRRRPRAANAVSYADMLIEKLLAEASSDSDSSPPRAEKVLGGSQNGSNLFQLDMQPLKTFPTDASVASSMEPSHVPAMMSDNFINGAIQAPSHNTTDSGLVGSDHVSLPAVYIPGLVGSDHVSLPAVYTPRHVQQREADVSIGEISLNSTPDLPASESSTDLDIRFASFFDLIDSENIKDLPAEEKPAHYLFQSRHPHITTDLQEVGPNSYPQLTCPDTVSEVSPVCRPSSGEKRRSSTSSSIHRKSEMITADLGFKPDISYYEQLVVCLPPPPEDFADHVFDKDDVKSDMKPEAVSSQEPELPPLPPRRPLMDTKQIRQDLNEKCDSAQCSCKRSCHAASEKASLLGVSSNFSVNNNSWSFHQLPDTPTSSFMNVSRERSLAGDRYVTTVRPQQHHVTVRPRCAAADSVEVIHSIKSGSASKRRKGNDKLAMPVSGSRKERRRARQRLFTSPVTVGDISSSSDNECTLTSPFIQPLPNAQDYSLHTGQSPAFRRLKVHNALSPSQISRSPRKPLGELYNTGFTQSSFISFTTSVERNAKQSAASHEVYLPNRTEELLERDVVYGDFTVDRQSKIDRFVAMKTKAPRTNDEHVHRHRGKDPADGGMFIRKVEGAECSPVDVFRVPASHLRAPRTLAQTQRQHMPRSVGFVRGKGDRFSDTSNSSDVRTSHSSVGFTGSSSSSSVYPSSSSSSRHHSRHSRKSSSLSSRSSSKSHSSSRKSCTSHPMACSTFIMDSSFNSPGTTTDENLRAAQNRTEKKGKQRPLRSPDIRYSSVRPRARNISHVKSHLDVPVSHSGRHRLTVDTFGCCLGNLDIQSHAPNENRDVLAASNSFLATPSSDSGSGSQFSNQATTSSMVFNQAAASVVSTSTDTSSVKGNTQCSQEFSHSKNISASEPDLRPNHSADKQYSSVSTDTAEESSAFDSRPEITGKSSSSSSSGSSGSSKCRAARCTPWVVVRKTEALGLSEPSTAPQEYHSSVDELNSLQESNSLPDQDLLDSILTDSPKSVNSSGVMAPYNSSNSPAESVACDTATVNNTASSRTYQNVAAPPATPNAVGNVENSTTTNMSVPSQHAADSQEEFKRPFTLAPSGSQRATNAPAPGGSQSATNAPAPGGSQSAATNAPVPGGSQSTTKQTRNQGVTADPSPQRLTSSELHNEAQSRRYEYVMPPGIITGPPKIKDKNSLVKKLKKFGSNFCKRDKFQTLANL